MGASEPESHFVICLKNENYPASLEPRKVYETMPDAEAGRHGLIRVIDESGEDYLYPNDYFAPIQLPKAAEHVFSAVA